MNEFQSSAKNAVVYFFAQVVTGKMWISRILFCHFGCLHSETTVLKFATY